MGSSTTNTRATARSSVAAAGLEVIFGTGPVACAAAGFLLDQGKRVRMVNRTGGIPPWLVEGLSPERKARLDIVRADVTDASAARAAAEGALRIYNCAHAPYNQWGKVLPVLYRNLVTAAIEQGAVLAVAQNLYMYARGLPVIDDDARVEPPSHKGRLIQGLHETLQEAGARGLRWTAVRASDFYGPGATGQSVFGSDRFLGPLSEGRKPMLVGDPDQPHTYTYVGDFGGALAVAALSPEAYGRAWIVPNDRTLSTRQMAGLFFAATGKAPGFRLISRPVLAVTGLFDPVIRELMEVLHQKEEPYVIDGSAFQRKFGFSPTPLEEGVQRTVEWYRGFRT